MSGKLKEKPLQTWRRRHLRLIGSSLVAYNDVTKRAIATIDLTDNAPAAAAPVRAGTAATNVIDLTVDEPTVDLAGDEEADEEMELVE